MKKEFIIQITEDGKTYYVEPPTTREPGCYN